MSISLFPHNQTAYESVQRLLRDTGKAAIVHPTGTGKSFIAFKLCEEHPQERICWLAPSEYIFETQIENLRATGADAPENIQFYTYAQLMNMSRDELDGIAPDYIVLDEFHRCGAEMWGRGVQQLLTQHRDTPVLGLSATNIRYLDNQRDMADELFDGNIASRMTLGEAIVRGILKTPVYVTALYSYQKDIDRYEQRVRNARNKAVRDAGERYLEALRRNLEMAEGLDKLFSKYITRKDGKYIVFCSGAEHMREMRSHVPEWFGSIDSEPHVYTAYSSDPAVSRSFQSFKADRSEHLKLLFCINMLNEGVHIEDISGVILMRPTVSPIIYKQQIGRALSACGGETPLILDIVNNIASLYSIDAIQDEINEAAQFYEYLGEDGYAFTDRFVIKDEARNVRELFDELEGVLSAPWELMYLEAKKYYETFGDLLPELSYMTEYGYRLGQWVNTQRQDYRNGDLSEEKTAQLEQIGMDWRTPHQRGWDSFFEQAERFYNETGSLRCDKSREPGLYNWLVRQRQKYHANQLNEQQISKLNQLGMVWESDDGWEEKLAAAERYYTEHGNLDIPAQYVTEDGTELGAWYRLMRRKHQQGSLSTEQTAELERVGMQWEDYNSRAWQRSFELAREYFAEHGDLNIPAKFETADGTKLGAWITGQRYSYAGGKLSDEQIRQLEQIGMTWQHHSNRWDAGFAHLQIYAQKNGTTDVPKDFVSEDGLHLGQWAAAQRSRYKAGKLKASQVQRMEQIGFSWSVMKSQWERSIAAAEKYAEAHGSLDCPPDYVTCEGFALGTWIKNLRTKYRKNQLTAEQIQQLEAIGMLWSANEERWQTGFLHAKEYKSVYGDTDILSSYISPDGYRLGDWSRAQKRSFKNGALSTERQQKLSELGFQL